MKQTHDDTDIPTVEILGTSKPNVLDKLKLDQALKLAKKKTNSGSIDEAKQIYQDILKKFSKNKPALMALQLLNKAKATVPNEPPLDQLQFISSLYAQGQLQQALSKASKALLNFPNSVVLCNIAGACNAGLMQFDAAIDHYKQALILKPDYDDVYNNMGLAQYAKGDLDASITSYQKAIKIKPTNAEVHMNMGTALLGKGQMTAAIASYQQAIKVKPNYAQAYSNIGNVLKDKGDLKAAIVNYKKALDIEPNYAEVYNSMGVALQSRGDLDEALNNYKKALGIKPDYAEAHNHIGITLKDKGDLTAAITHYKKAIQLKPSYAQAYNNMGITLMDKGDLAAAINSYKRAIKIKPNYAEAFSNMGNALKDEGNLDAAIKSYQQALSIKPSYTDAHNNMGAALKDKGDLKAAILCYERVIKINPNSAEAYYNMGIALQAKDDLEATQECYQQAIRIKPNYYQAYYNLGLVMELKGRLDLAIESYQQALAINPKYAKARAKKLHQQAHICDWDAIEEDRLLIPELGVLTQAVSPFSLLSFEDSPKQHQMRSINYVKEIQGLKPLPNKPQPSQKEKKLRIGYFSADFYNHATMHLMVKLFESHNQKEFDIYAYSFGPNKNDEMRQRLIKAVDVFHDVTNMSDQEAALLAQSNNLDIAVDLKGFTKNSRLGIFVCRAAPIQISYLGYPGTSGAKFIDYIIADDVVIPQEFESLYSESIIRLPHTYQPNNNSRMISDKVMTRIEMGLPEQGFVFCCFNNSYKISSSEFDIWMRILDQVKGSVLWLIKANKWAVKNLKMEAERRGVAGHRLIFADKINHSAHLARHRLADLFIDSFNYNAHTTASDALWAGLPIVTKLGKGFAARVAGSLLTSIDLPELIVKNNKDYELLILDLAKNPKRLVTIREKLASNRLSTPLFNTELFTKHIEDSYQQAYQQYADGKPSKNILVTDQLTSEA